MPFRPSFQNQESLSQEGSDLSFEETFKKVFELLRPWFRSLPAETRTQYYTPLEVAQIMRLNPQTVMKLCREKRIIGHKPPSSNKWLIAEEEIEKYLSGVLLRKAP